MALTPKEQNRLQVIEIKLAELKDTLNSLPTRQEVIPSLNIRQAQITKITALLNTLEVQVELLQQLFIL